jgi:hypothetical protein
MSAFPIPKSVADVLVDELDRQLSRESGLVPANTAAIVVGQVMGRQVVGGATSAVKASGANTGNGTLTLDGTTPVLTGAKVGTYQVRYTGANTFVVLDPDGFQIGYGGTEGTTWANKVKFQTAAGGTAMVAGDGFDIAVAYGTMGLVPINPAALDGSDVAYGIAVEPLASLTAAAKLTIIARNACVAAGGLVWGSLTQAQQTKATLQLLQSDLRIRVAN